MYRLANSFCLNSTSSLSTIQRFNYCSTSKFGTFSISFNSNPSSKELPSTKYSRLVKEGKIREDEHQVKALDHLDRLHTDVLQYEERKVPNYLRLITKLY